MAALAEQRSASEPVLNDKDYFVPKCSPGPRTKLGNFDKDTGEYTSLVGRLGKDGAKVPGPGKYAGHEEWSAKRNKANSGNLFIKSDRFNKLANSVPAPPTYENKDFSTKGANRNKEFLSQNPRVLMGKLSKGSKRSFIDRSIAFSTSLPGPGVYSPKPAFADRLDLHTKGTVSYAREVSKTKSLAKAGPSSAIAPNTYKVSHNLVDDRVPKYSFPKDAATNFLDKALDTKNKKEVPGPGSYNTHTFDHEKKLSHGPIVKSSLARAPLSSYL